MMAFLRTVMNLQLIDWVIVWLYLGGMIVLGAFLGRNQKNSRDYFLAGNDVSPLPIACSTMATQCSTNSLLGAPAFVAFAAGGGLVWLQYELAVPFAMIVLMLFIFPVFRSLRLITVYDYLERRFGPGTRLVISIMFQVLRAFSTGVTVFSVSLVVQLALGIPFWAAVLLLGVVTIIYDVLGGMKAVIWSDVAQLIVLAGSMVAALFVTVHAVGGWSQVLDAVEPARLRTIDWRGHGFGDGKTFAFWPMLFGGLFLYVSYYGCDQTQAQRMLSSRNVAGTNRALFLDGMLRFPLVLTYCAFGVALAAYAAKHPEFIASLPLRAGRPDINTAVPVFVGREFPPGLVGLVAIGLFAAAMSSLDSTLNALSALTMEDVFKRFRKRPLEPRREILLSKLLTALWGAACLSFAFTVDRIAETVIESVNKIGSLLNGPLLAVFMLGMLVKRVEGRGAVSGLLAGFVANVGLWKFAPGVSWLWWNPAGFAVAALVAVAVSAARSSRPVPDPHLMARKHMSDFPRGLGFTLAIYGALILVLLIVIQTM
jgi:SSS family solute:Na+ symporter